MGVAFWLTPFFLFPFSIPPLLPFLELVKLKKIVIKTIHEINKNYIILSELCNSCWQSYASCSTYSIQNYYSVYCISKLYLFGCNQQYMSNSKCTCTMHKNYYIIACMYLMVQCQITKKKMYNLCDVMA